jgi:hypothetical protein
MPIPSVDITIHAPPAVAVASIPATTVGIAIPVPGAVAVASMPSPTVVGGASGSTSTTSGQIMIVPPSPDPAYHLHHHGDPVTGAMMGVTAIGVLVYGLLSLRPCLRCGALTRAGSYCERHVPLKRPSSSQNRPSPYARRRAKDAVGNRSQDCGCAPTEDNSFEVDAVVPVAEGGSHEPGNTRGRCRRCHRIKTRADVARRRAPGRHVR